MVEDGWNHGKVYPNTWNRYRCNSGPRDAIEFSPSPTLILGLELFRPFSKFAFSIVSPCIVMFLPKTPKILILFSNGKYCNFRFSIFDFHFWIFEFITVPLSFHSTPQVPPPVILIIVPTPFLFLFYSPDPSNSSPHSPNLQSLSHPSISKVHLNPVSRYPLRFSDSSPRNLRTVAL